MVALAAPLLFNDYHEFSLGNIAIIIMLLVCGRIDEIKLLIQRYSKKESLCSDLPQPLHLSV